MNTRRQFVKNAMLAVVGASCGHRASASLLAAAHRRNSGGGTVFTDDFIRANADPMSDPASGGTWTPGAGGLNNPKILSNTLQASSGQTGANVATPAFAADQVATVTIGGSSFQAFGPMVRSQGPTDASGYLAYLGSTTSVTVYRITDTGTLAFTSLGSRSVSALSVGDSIGLGIVGSTLTVYRNGIAQGATLTDATYASGRPGLYLGSTAPQLIGFTATS